MYPYFAHKFARGLECVAVEVTDTSAVLRLQSPDRIAQQFGLYKKACAVQTCASSKGRIAMVPVRLHGLPPATVTDRACIVQGDDYCEWGVRWAPEPHHWFAWPVWGTVAGLAAFAYLRVAHPAISVIEALLVALVPTLASGFVTSRRVQEEARRREALIQEQVTFVEARHEELRGAYLEQEQTRVELRRKVNQLTALHRSGLLFNSTFDREVLLQEVLETLTRDLHYDRAMISFYDPVRKVLAHAHIIGVPPEIQAFVRSKETPMIDPHTPEGGVVLQGRPLLIEDLREVWGQISPLNRQLAELTNTKTVIAVPLKTKDRILGTLTVDRIQAHSLTPDDLELMTTMANQVAIALDNASVYEQIEALNVGLEAKVRERTAELEQADRVRSEFLSHVSHELKTPLTAIMGFVQNLPDGLTGPLNEQQQLYLSRMLDNSNRLIRMIEDLLDRTRIQSGKLDLVPGEVDLGPCVADAVEQLRLLAQAKRQTLEPVASPAPLMVWADRDRLIQIVMNLAQNAVKFTPEGGSIIVTVRQENQMLAGVSVRDTGPGIAPEFLDQIFDPFFQSNRPVVDQKGWAWVSQSCGHWWSYKVGRSPHGANWGKARNCLLRFHCVSPITTPRSLASADASRILVVEDNLNSRQFIQDRLRATVKRCVYGFQAADLSG